MYLIEILVLSKETFWVMLSHEKLHHQALELMNNSTFRESKHILRTNDTSVLLLNRNLNPLQYMSKSILSGLRHLSFTSGKVACRPLFARYSTMSSVTKYDAIVIGSGQAGSPLAVALAKAGKKTAIIESTHIGGCCINDGCTPTKTMIASGRVAYLSRRAAKDYGVHAGGDVTVDMQRVRERKRDIVKSFRGGSERRLKDAGITIVMGTASFTGSKEVKVTLNEGGEASYAADQIFINTGERPAVPKLDGLQEVREKIPEKVLDSTSIQELSEVPKALLVLGGGYIGLEFGQLFSRLGSKVTIVQRGSRLMPREDPDITECLKGILDEDGLEILLSTAAVRISTGSDKSIELVVKDSGGSEKTLSGTHILLAAGRAPNTDMLNLKAAGVSANEKGYIQTNERLETSTDGVYALGDVKGPPAFTHISYDDFRILRDSMALGGSNGRVTTRTTKSRDGLVPYVAYTDPQLGHVGLHLSEIPTGQKVKVAKMPMSYVARALETDETRGMMKAVVDAETGKILGFTCLGIEGGELMSAVQLAMMGGLTYHDLEDAVFAHPSIAECLNNLWGFLEDV
jgi:pyruvate/2-oxoglutarate dehydrogenase complex dihydrolipoamide dehydrogenase (E3) component